MYLSHTSTPTILSCLPVPPADQEILNIIYNNKIPTEYTTVYMYIYIYIFLAHTSGSEYPIKYSV